MVNTINITVSLKLMFLKFLNILCYHDAITKRPYARLLVITCFIRDPVFVILLHICLNVNFTDGFHITKSNICVWDFSRPNTKNRILLIYFSVNLILHICFSFLFLFFYVDTVRSWLGNVSTLVPLLNVTYLVA